MHGEAKSLHTEDGYHTWDAFNRRFIASYIEDQGNLMPMLFILARRDPMTNKELSDLASVVVASDVDFNTGPAKDAFMAVCRAFTVVCDGVAASFSSECWTIDPEVFEGYTEEQINAWQQKWSGRFQDHPKRIEQIMLKSEHREFGDMFCRADLVRNPDDHSDARLGEWEIHRVGGTNDMTMRGRMNGFLMPAHVNKHPEFMEIVRIAAQEYLSGKDIKFELINADQITKNH